MARFCIYIESGLVLRDKTKLSLLPSLLTHPHRQNLAHLASSVFLLLGLLHHFVIYLFTSLTPLSDCEAPEVRYSVFLISDSLLPLLGRLKV